MQGGQQGVAGAGFHWAETSVHTGAQNPAAKILVREGGREGGENSSA
jgi:hypothetical protein